MVILNLTNKNVKYPLGFNEVDKSLVLSNYDNKANKMRPYEASIYELKIK